MKSNRYSGEGTTNVHRQRIGWIAIAFLLAGASGRAPMGRARGGKPIGGVRALMPASLKPRPAERNSSPTIAQSATAPTLLVEAKSPAFARKKFKPQPMAKFSGCSGMETGDAACLRGVLYLSLRAGNSSRM